MCQSGFTITSKWMYVNRRGVGSIVAVHEKRHVGIIFIEAACLFLS